MPSGVLTPPPLLLPQVTLLAVTDVALAATARALALSQYGIRFGDALFLSPVPPPPDTPATWRVIASLGSRGAYSRFMLHDLGRHIATSHALCVQWDGYVLNPAGWDPTFLDYDYIGAPWPQFADGMSVGNGGFSLRSRALIEACRALPVPDEPEDVAICRTHRPMLEAQGLRFAPEQVARRFAFERTRPTGREFGFHGAFNLAGGTDLPALFAALEPELLNRREHRQTLQAALRRGDWRLAATLWRRLRDPRARRH